MSEVAVRVSLRSHTFVHLGHVYACPGYLFVGQGTQHLPRSVAAADGCDEAAACSDGGPRLGGDDCGRLLRDRLAIGKYVNLHEGFSNWYLYARHHAPCSPRSTTGVYVRGWRWLQTLPPLTWSAPVRSATGPGPSRKSGRA